ncbi:MAG: hypothetical protein ACFFAH_04190 [Promethearchaeota archaeon]
MLGQTIFIIDKEKNILIFLGLLDENVEIKQEELSNILGEIVSKTNNLTVNSFLEVQIKEKNYFLGNFDKIIIVIQHLKEESPPEEFLFELNQKFLTEYYNILENYTENEINKFKSFLGTVKIILPKYINRQLKDLTDIGSEPIIGAMKRDTYPEGISDYKKDEVFWNEASMIKEKYPANFIEGMIFNLEIYLTISSTQNYKVFVDFSNYPEKPIININGEINRELGKNLEDLLYFYKNWNIKKPPHVIEIIDELVVVLKKFKEQGKLKKTSEIPKNALPDLIPLPNINNLKKKHEIK